jgi:GAF domain-containing protein
MNRILSTPARLTVAAIDAVRYAIRRSARQAVPAIADFCLVHLVCGRTIRCIAGSHSTRQGARIIRELMKTHRIRPGDRDSTVAHVVRTRRATLRTDIHPDRDMARAGGVADLHRRLAPTSALVVPIVHHGAVLGALSLCYSHSGRSYTSRHVASAQRLASRIADTVIPTAAVHAGAGLRTAARTAGNGSALRRRATPRQ